jgi:hypothetical protein
MKPMIGICGHHAEIMNLKVGGTYNYNCPVKG